MNILVVGSGANYSTLDVERGCMWALKELRHEIIYYDLFKRIAFYMDAYKDVKVEFDNAPEGAEEFWKFRMIKSEASQGAIYNAVKYWPIDLILVISGTYFSPEVAYVMNKLECSNALFSTEEPYDYELIKGLVRVYQNIFLNDDIHLEEYRSYNPNIWELWTACNPSIHKKMEVEDEYKSDIFFCGVMFRERLEFFEKLIECLDGDLDIKIRGTNIHQKLSPNSPIRKYCVDGIIPNREVAKYYNGAKIILAPHRQSKQLNLDERIEEAHSPAPRVFEAGACGGFQMVDNSRGEVMRRLFPKIPLFNMDDIPETAAMIEYYLNHPKERKEIAENIQEKVLKDHTYLNRMRFLLSKIGGEN